MSLQQVLTNLSNARGGIVSALSGRGLTVSSSTTLTSAATVISTLPMSGSVDVSDTTAQAANVQSGYYFYTSGGVRTAGTLVSTDFYKCATVDSTNHTWTGYKAVLNQSGYYEFESTATTGLTYNPDKVTPVVDMCYTDGALLLVEPYSPDILEPTCMAGTSLLTQFNGSASATV